jgi:hypothetical protein
MVRRMPSANDPRGKRSAGANSHPLTSPRAVEAPERAGVHGGSYSVPVHRGSQSYSGTFRTKEFARIFRSSDASAASGISRRITRKEKPHFLHRLY